VRNIRLKLAPILIIPFEDEIGQVRHARVYTPHARTDTHLLVCRSSLTIMQSHMMGRAGPRTCCRQSTSYRTCACG
jgi:hypothetical protein